MTTTASFFIRAVALAGVLLAASQPLRAQSLAGQIYVFEDLNDGNSGKADFYVVNATRATLTGSVVNWTFSSAWPVPFQVAPWNAIANTGVDLSTKAGNGYLQVTISGSAGSATVYVTNNTQDHVNEVWWTLSGSGSGWTTSISRVVDPTSGACAYTSMYTAAIFGTAYAVTLTKAFWNDKENQNEISKVVLMVSEILPGTAGKIYKACQAFTP